jgi:hypothetical protein
MLREVPGRHKGGKGRFLADIRKAQGGSKQTRGRRREVPANFKEVSTRF